MQDDLEAMNSRLAELKKSVKENSKRISELEKEKLVIEYKGLTQNSECAKGEIETIENYINKSTMENCQHLYAMGKDPDIDFDDDGEFDMPFCIKCGLDSLYSQIERVETTKQMNIYSICNSGVGIPKGTFLVDEDGKPIRCDREEAYSIYKDIVQGVTDIHNDTIEVLFIDALEERNKNKKGKPFQKKGV